MFADPPPAAGTSEILGLLEFLDEHGGRADVSRLAHELQMDSAALLLIVRGAEVLEVVHTPGNEVVLLPLGKRVIESDMNTKKAIVREQMEKLPMIRFFIDFLSNHPEKAVEKQVVLDEIAGLAPSHDPEEVYSTLLKWGRYGEIFGFSHDTGRFFLNTRGRRRRAAGAKATSGGPTPPPEPPPA